MANIATSITGHDARRENLLLADRRLLFDIHNLNAPVFSGEWIGGVLEIAPAEANGQQLVR
jgi:hypothetical protein